jgi:hypothetical protein
MEPVLFFAYVEELAVNHDRYLYVGAGAEGVILARFDEGEVRKYTYDLPDAGRSPEYSKSRRHFVE